MKMNYALAVAAGTAVLLSACSGPTATPVPNWPTAPAQTMPTEVSTPVPSAAEPSTEEPSTEPSPLPIPSATALQPTPDPSPTSPLPSTSPTTSEEQPFASRPGSFERVPVTARMYRVQRSGNTATVNLYIAAKDSGDWFALGDQLGDGNTETASKSMFSIDGIRLIDTAAKKAYLPAVTADGSCVCSPDDDGTNNYSNSVWVTVTFAAPPTTSTKVNVSVPTFGTFTDVPVS